MGERKRPDTLTSLPPGLTARPRRRATTERLHAFPAVQVVAPTAPVAVEPPRIFVPRPAPVSPPATRTAPPTRFASGTVPPPVERPLPSILAVVSRIRRETAERLIAAHPDEVEVINVDLEDDEMILSESDITLID